MGPASGAETPSTRRASKLFPTRCCAWTASGARKEPGDGRPPWPHPHAHPLKLRPPPRRSEGSKVLGVAALVVALDQATKQAALRALADGPVDVIEGAVTLDLSFNTGGVFGIFPGAPALFAVATALIVVTLLVWSRRITEARWLVPVGMVIGGGIGNLTDRILREGGRVVDFIDLHVWPTFNLADSAIVVGVVLVVWFGARAPKVP